MVSEFYHHASTALKVYFQAALGISPTTAKVRLAHQGQYERSSRIPKYLAFWMQTC
jgi:hypothetical protein